MDLESCFVGDTITTTQSCRVVDTGHIMKPTRERAGLLYRLEDGLASLIRCRWARATAAKGGKMLPKNNVKSARMKTDQGQLRRCCHMFAPCGGITSKYPVKVSLLLLTTVLRLLVLKE